MSDYHDLLENIRSFSSAADQSRTDDLAGWAEEYARLAREANDRLRRCADCLQQGLRDEAIHLADAAPNLLDTVAALDFPELEDWKNICLQYGLREPPRLLIEIAGGLNEAYAEAQPLVGLMAHHRLMALARAPLPARLRVLRRIADMDKASGFWDEDIRTFERARLDQIRAQVPQSLRAGDGAVLGQLLREIGGDPWRVKVPPDLARAVHDAARQTQANSALVALRQLLPRINGAYGAMDVEECRGLLNQWQTLIAESGITLPTDLQELIDPVTQWMAEEFAKKEQRTAFAAACDELQQALDVDAPPVVLERRYLTVVRIPLETPPQLEARYRQRIAARASAAKTKRVLIGAGIAAAFLLAAGVTFIIAYQHLRAEEMREVTAVLQQAQTDAAAGDPDKAERAAKDVVEQHPRIALAPLVAKALADVQADVAKERQRQTDFQSHMKAASDAGVEHPDQTDLQAADQLAKLPDEQSAVAQLKANIAQYASDQQLERDHQFAIEAKKLLSDAEGEITDELLARDTSAYEKALNGYEAQVQALTSRSGISDSLKQAELTSIAAFLKQKRESWERSGAEKAMFAQLEDFGGTVTSHQEALKRYLESFPNSARSTSFQLALQQEPEEVAVESWGHIAGPWHAEIVPATYATATERVTAIEGFLKQYPDAAVSRGVTTYLNYLKLGLTVAAPDGPWKKGFRDLLNNPLVHDLECVETSSGKAYYSLPGKWNFGQPVKKVDGTIKSETFDAVTSSDIGKLTRAIVEDPDLLRSTTPSPSPQAKYAQAAITSLEELDFAGWEFIGVRTLDSLNKTQDMNPVLKAILLENLLQFNQPVFDWIGEKEYKKVLGRIADLKVDDVEWLDPANPPPASLREQASGTFNLLPRETDLEEKIRGQRDTACNAANFQIRSEGMLLKAENGNWRIAGGTCLPGDAGFIIGDRGALSQVATYEKDKWDFAAADAASLTEGQLVFIGTLPK
jgi:hypothetical protein